MRRGIDDASHVCAQLCDHRNLSHGNVSLRGAGGSDLEVRLQVTRMFPTVCVNLLF